jgi:hypothetical protein
VALSCLADLALRDGDFGRADRLCAEGQARAEEVGDVESIGVNGLNRAYAALGNGRPAAAIGLAVRALEAWSSLGDPAAMSNAIDAIAAVLAPSRPEDAAVLLGAAEELRAPTGTERDAYEIDVRRGAEDEVRRRLGAEGLEDGISAGRRLSAPEAVAAAQAASRSSSATHSM